MPRKAMDLTGRKFGRLTVLYESNYKIQLRSKTWVCECECGNKILANTGDLTRKKRGIKSCGCLSGDVIRANKYQDLTGKRFGRLLVIEKSNYTNKYGRTFWRCKCDCGNEIIRPVGDLNTGRINSCGCLHSETSRKQGLINKKHGLSQTRIYSVWMHMINRCTNKNNKYYSRYGGRGITVYDEWMNDILSFVNWAENNGYTDELEIDRINNDGNYEPNNCRFVTRQQNMQNTSGKVISSSKYKGVMLSTNGKKWISQITVDNERINIGTFENEILAAYSYDIMAKKYFKEYAYLNFPKKTNLYKVLSNTINEIEKEKNKIKLINKNINNLYKKLTNQVELNKQEKENNNNGTN